MSVRELAEVEVEVLWHRWRQGDSLRRIGRDIGASTYEVRRYMLRCGGVRPPERKRADRHLTVAERELIAAGAARGDSYRAIARRLGRAASTISREVSRNGGPDAYRPGLAEDRSRGMRSRRKPSKLAVNNQLRAQVAQWLQLQWSPEQIAHRLPLEYPDDQLMRVSHECIYLAIYQPSRRALERGSHRHLRSGRQVRNPKRPRLGGGRGELRNITSIHDRPAHVEARDQLGHWEGDLIMGRRPTAVATLVERRTRLTRLVRVTGIKAAPVKEALVSDLARIPADQRLTLTWDRGREMAEHQQLAHVTGTTVYFCDPRSPWQRGTNENTNRLLRQYLSKTADLSQHTQAHLNTIADRLNNRPRKILNWRTPNEVYAETVTGALTH